MGKLRDKIDRQAMRDSENPTMGRNDYRSTGEVRDMLGKNYGPKGSGKTVTTKKTNSRKTPTKLSTPKRDSKPRGMAARKRGGK